MSASRASFLPGRSSRMGGTDKALLPLPGETLLARAIARLAPQVSHIVISANGELNRFAQYALPVVADRAPDYPGPLAGILAGLEWVAANRPDIRRVVSVPTDTPFFPVDLVDRFLAEPPRIPTLLVARSEACTRLLAFGRSRSRPSSPRRLPRASARSAIGQGSKRSSRSCFQRQSSVGERSIPFSTSIGRRILPRRKLC